MLGFQMIYFTNGFPEPLFPTMLRLPLFDASLLGLRGLVLRRALWKRKKTLALTMLIWLFCTQKLYAINPIYKIVKSSNNVISAWYKFVIAATFDAFIWITTFPPFAATTAKNTGETSAVGLIHPCVNEGIVTRGWTTQQHHKSPGDCKITRSPIHHSSVEVNYMPRQLRYGVERWNCYHHFHHLKKSKKD